MRQRCPTEHTGHATTPCFATAAFQVSKGKHPPKSDHEWPRLTNVKHNEPLYPLYPRARWQNMAKSNVKWQREAQHCSTAKNCANHTVDTKKDYMNLSKLPGDVVSHLYLTLHPACHGWIIMLRALCLQDQQLLLRGSIQFIIAGLAGHQTKNQKRASVFKLQNQQRQTYQTSRETRTGDGLSRNWALPQHRCQGFVDWSGGKPDSTALANLPNWNIQRMVSVVRIAKPLEKLWSTIYFAL